jgi:membrane-associated protease RseP (regulator of RpoE activity)
MSMRRFRPVASALGLLVSAALAQPVSAQIGEEVRPRAQHDSVDHRAEMERHRAEMMRHQRELERHAREMNEALVRAYRDSTGELRMFYRDGALDSARHRFLYRTSVRTPCARMGIAFDGDETIIVREVMEGSGADEAGVEEGDVIVSVDGERANLRVMAELAESMEAGDRIRLVVRRDGSERTLDVTAREDVCPYRTMLSEEPFRVFCVRSDSTGALATDEECEAGFEFQVGPMRRLEATPWVSVIPDSGGWYRFEGFDGVRGFSDSIFIDLDSVRMMSDALVFQLDSLREMIPFTFHMADSLRMIMPRMRDEMRTFEEDARAHSLMLRSMELGAHALAGARLTPLNEDLAAYFEAERGVLVTDVEDGTPAARAGLLGGDVIVAVNGNDVNDVPDVHRHAARAEGPIELSVMRRGERRTIRLAE